MSWSSRHLAWIVSVLLLLLFCTPAPVLADPPTSVVFVDSSGSMANTPDAKLLGELPPSLTRDDVKTNAQVVRRWVMDQVKLDLGAGRRVMLIPFDRKARPLLELLPGPDIATGLREADEFLRSQSPRGFTSIWNTIQDEIRRGTLGQSGLNSSVYVYTDGADNSGDETEVEKSRQETIKLLRERWNLSEESELGLYILRCNAFLPPPNAAISIMDPRPVSTKFGQLRRSPHHVNMRVRASFSESTGGKDEITDVIVSAAPVSPQAAAGSVLPVSAWLDAPLTKSRPEGMLTLRIDPPEKVTRDTDHELAFTFRLISQDPRLDANYRDRRILADGRVTVHVSSSMPELLSVGLNPVGLTAPVQTDASTVLEINGSPDASGMPVSVRVTAAPGTTVSLEGGLPLEAGSPPLKRAFPADAALKIPITVRAAEAGSYSLPVVIDFEGEHRELVLQLAVNRPVISIALKNEGVLMRPAEGTDAQNPWQPLAAGPLVFTPHDLPKDHPDAVLDIKVVGDADVEVALTDKGQRSVLLPVSGPITQPLYVRWSPSAKNRVRPSLPRLQIKPGPGVDRELAIQPSDIDLTGTVSEEAPLIRLTADGGALVDGVLVLPKRLMHVSSRDTREVTLSWNYAARGSRVTGWSRPSPVLEAALPPDWVASGNAVEFNVPLDSASALMTLPVTLKERMFLSVSAAWEFSIEGGNQARVRAGYDALPTLYTAAITEPSSKIGLDERFVVGRLQLAGTGAEDSIEVEFAADAPPGLDLQLGLDDPLNPFTTQFILDAASPRTSVPIVAQLKFTGGKEARRFIFTKPIHARVRISSQVGPAGVKFSDGQGGELPEVILPLTLVPTDWVLHATYRGQETDRIPPVGHWDFDASPTHDTGEYESGTFRLQLVGPNGATPPKCSFRVASDDGVIASGAFVHGGEELDSVTGEQLASADGVQLRLRAAGSLPRRSIGSDELITGVTVLSEEHGGSLPLQVIGRVGGKTPIAWFVVGGFVLLLILWLIVRHMMSRSDSTPLRSTAEGDSSTLFGGDDEAGETTPGPTPSAREIMPDVPRPPSNDSGQVPDAAPKARAPYPGTVSGLFIDD